MTFDNDSATGYSRLYINGARVIDADEEVENGVVHAIAAVMNPSSNTVPAQIDDMKFLSLFSEALTRTGLDEKLHPYKDFSYTGGNKTTITIYGKSGCPYPRTAITASRPSANPTRCTMQQASGTSTTSIPAVESGIPQPPTPTSAAPTMP